MSAHAHSSIRRAIAGATAALLIAVGLTVASETVAPVPASAAQDPTQCANAVSLTNGGFEAPAIGNATYRLVPEAQVPGWGTNDSQNQIEIWSTGFQGVPAAAGRQFAELNANSASRLFQDVATTPGQTLYWSLKHRGRSGTDTMRVLIGSPSGTLVQSGPNLTDGNAAWGSHAGVYTVPAGQTVTRFAFEAVSATGGASQGNFLDDISFGTGPCLISTKSVANLTRGGSSAEIGDTLRYTVTTRNDGGNPALQSVSTDALPAGVDFVPGSLRIVSGPGAGALTDAAGDDRGEYASGTRTLRVRLGDNGTATAGGSVGVDAVTSYTFDAKVRPDAAGTTVVNEARVVFREPVTNVDRTSTTQETLTPVNQAADLAITKTLDTSPLVAGQPATFTIGVTNNGPQTGTGVTVTDAVPAGLTGVQATPSGGSCTVGGTITCSLPDLAVGASATITVTGTVSPSFDPGAALTNTASVSGARFDVDLANNTATASGTLTAVSDVSVTKTFSPETPVAGQNVTYTLITRNDGPSEARDVRLTDPLDPETTFVSVLSDQGECAVDLGVVECSIGTLAPGAAVSTTIVVSINPAAAVVQNSASVTSSTPDSDPTNNVDSTSFQPDIIADLAVTKTPSVTQVAAGDTVDFTIAVTNNGDSDAVNAVLDDTVPSGFTVTGVTTPAGADCSFTDTTVRCTWADLVDQATATVVVSTVVAADAPAGTTSNTASVASPAEDVDTTNNSASAEVEIVQSADLSIAKTAPATGTPGSGFTYSIEVTNNGPSVARAVTITDTLPAGFTVESINPGCTIDGGTVNCAAGDLAPGATASVDIGGSWSATATGTIGNTATTTSATPDPDTGNNTSSVDVSLTPSAAVSVVKTTSTPSIPLGGEASFVITVRNDGPSAAAGIVVTDAAPEGLDITSGEPSVGTWSPADHQWTVGTLLPGVSATLTVTATATAVGSLTNTATATSPTPDPDPSDNTGTSTVVVTPSADLSIVKTTSVNPAPANGPITYTIVVTNSGPSPASAVVISDALPAGLQNATTPTAGCSIIAAQLDCAVGDLAVDATFTATVSGTVDPAIASATLSNTATVTSTTPDPDPSDNTSTVEVPVTGTPLVELLKSAGVPVDANDSGRTDAGDTVAYTFTVRNTGPVTLTSAVLTDPLLGGTVPCAALEAPLAPAASVTCGPVEYVLTQQDIDAGTVRNEASVAAESARGTATDDAEATVTVPAVNGIALTKTPSIVTDVDGDGQVSVDDTIAYTFTVTNTGTTTLTDAQITDPMLGGAVDCAELAGASLAPGGSVTCAPVDYTLTQDDIDDGVVRNTASVTADAPIGNVSDTASASADIEQTSGIDLLKSVGQVQDANGDGFIGAGDTIQYTFTASNPGTTTLTDVVVTDPLLGDDVLCTVATLAVGASSDCGPFTYTLTQADIESGRRPNTATASGTGPLGEVRDDASAEVVITGAPGIALTKTPGEPVDADGDDMIGAGDTIDYTFTVLNSGTIALIDIVIDDPLLGGVVECPALDGLSLAPSDDVECGPIEYVLTQDDIDAGIVRNTATVTGQSVVGSAESADDADVDVVGTDALTLAKSAAAVVDADGDGRTNAGDTIAYSFTVTNTGTTTLTSVAVSDPRLSGDVICDTTELAPGESTLCSAPPAVLTQAEIDAGEIVNTATATGTGTGEQPPTVDDTLITPLAVQPAVELVKSAGAPVDANDSGRTDAGDTVAYTFTVRNTGAVTLTSAVLSDPLLGGAVTCAALGAPLAPAASVTCGPVDYVLTQQDIDAGTVRNEASVTAESAQGTATDDAEANVTVPAVNSIVLTKTPSTVNDVDGDGQVSVDDTITYTFTVTNTGSSTLTDVQITDPMLGGAVACDELAGAPLAPGASVICAPVDYALTQDDIDDGVVRNTASVTAEAPSGNVSDTASAAADLDRSAGISLQKSVGQVQDANGDGAIGVGDIVEYTFSASNPGNTTLADVVITDPLLGDGVLCSVGALNPGESGECGPFTYTLTQEDIENGRRSNTATVTGTSPLGPVSDDSSAEVVFAGTPGVELTKTPGAPVDANGDGMIGVGDTVAYSFAIRNTGTVLLTDVVLDDPLLGGVVDCPALDGLSLAPSDEVECGPIAYELAQDDIDAGFVRNTATVTGQSGVGDAEDSAQADVIVIGTDELALLKSAAAVVDANGNGRTDAGDTIAYTFTVTNTGTTTLTGVAVSDLRLSGDVVCDTSELAPGESTLCDGPAAVLTQAEIDAGQIVNTATATGTGTGEEPPSVDATVTTPLEAQPAIALEKTGGEYADANGNGRIDAGDTVHFRFVVTNTGARTLTSVTIDDPKLGGELECDVPDLAPGNSAECGPIGYTLTAADVARGEVVNVATVSGAAGTVIVTGAATATVDLDVLATTGGIVTGLGWALALLAIGALVLLISHVRRREAARLTS